MTKPQDPTSHRRSQLLRRLYGPEPGDAAAAELDTLIQRCSPAVPEPPPPLSERDALLITYADQVREPGAPPLQTLAGFCERHLAGAVSGIHLLPFYPWSSDDGFAVKDYCAVAPEYGSWDDLARFRPRFDLMFDAVFNHLSAQGDWFQRFLRGDAAFRDFFVTVEGDPDLSRVVRPRALPLLTKFQPPIGNRQSAIANPLRVWTTFSADQVDLNFRNPRVLLAALEALLFYVSRGARFIRLDAIAYLWKEIGTPCIHLPQTHAVIQLMRAVLEEAAPGVRLITETNVPHADNISYFGDGRNEAQLVYNFALPPLVLHALLRGDATHLTRWAAALRTPSAETAFFNFLASHDGIGLNPARGTLPDAEIDFLAERCLAHGGFISYKHNPDGSKSPYEMNIVYFDALNDPAAGEPRGAQVDRFMAAQAIMLALAGVPGIYFHSLLGSRNDRPAAVDSGIPRRINRQKCDRASLERELADPTSLRAAVFGRFQRLLQVRRRCPAFHPGAAQAVLELDRRVFALERTSLDGATRALCLHNLSGETVALQAPASPALELRPYETAWLLGNTRLL